MKWVGRPVAEIWPFEIFPRWRWPPSWICSNRKYSAVRSAVPVNPTLEPNMKWIGSPVAEIWPFAYVRGIFCLPFMVNKRCSYGTPFWGRGNRRGSAMAPFERAMVVSYRLSIVTVALSVTIRPQLRSNISEAQINRGWVTLGQSFRVFPWSRPLMLGVAKSERPRLTNDEIIFEEFQPMWSLFIHQRHRRTDRRHAIAIPSFVLKCIAR